MKLTYRTIEVHPRRTFKIAVEAHDAFRPVIVELEHDGVVGYGEASPSTRVTGETPLTVAAFLDWAARELAGRGPDEWGAFLDLMHNDICGNPGARAAVDLAVHDLVGKLRGVPARALHGLPAGRLETSMTVSLDAPDVMAQEARGYRDAGFRCLKLKLGDAARDVERVEAVRRACPDARIRADANTNWSFADARRLLPELARLGVEFVEQPLRPEEDGAMVELSKHSPVPLYADESVRDALDVERLHKLGFKGGVNPKLQKAGGIRPTLETLRRAKALGYQVQLGCNVETSVGIAGALQLLGLLDHADLDGALLLRDDPFSMPAPQQGWYATPEAPGLGVTATRTS